MSQDTKFYFRCRTNPEAPLLVLESYWEAIEMRTNPDYDRVDEDGIPMLDEGSTAEQRIPFDRVSRKAKEK